MCQENISQEFRLKSIYKKRKYFFAERKQIELMSKNQKVLYKLY